MVFRKKNRQDFLQYSKRARQSVKNFLALIRSILLQIMVFVKRRSGFLYIIKSFLLWVDQVRSRQ